MQLEKGDGIEKLALEWIRGNLPEYEVIWSLFIGHNGRGSPLTIVGYARDSQEERDREAFYQAHYTLLQCLYQLQGIVAHIDKQQAYIPDPRAYLAIQRELTCFLANVGRARDMIKKMDTALGLKGEIWPRFQNLYQNRCSFLHGTIPAQRLDGGILEIPDLAGTEKSPSKWNDESRWSDAAQLRYDVAPAQLQAILGELIALSRGALSRFITRIKEILDSRAAHIESDPPELKPITAGGSTLGDALSGVQYYCYSGIAPRWRAAR